jgi:hypothetical protein
MHGPPVSQTKFCIQFSQKQNANFSSLVIPLSAFISIPLGGLGFNISQIANILAALAVPQMIVSFFGFPLLMRAFDVKGALKFCGTTQLIAFLFAPLCNLALRHDYKAIFWVCLIGCGFFSTLTNMMGGKSRCPTQRESTTY